MSTAGQRLSFSLCDETCPHVDAQAEFAIDAIRKMFLESDEREDRIVEIFSNMVDTFKEHGTYKLRNALDDICGRFVDLESERDHLIERVADLEWEIKNNDNRND